MIPWEGAMRLCGILLLTSILLPGAGSSQQAELLTQPGETPGIWGVLEAPDGPGPHPAVVLLHGSSGWRPEYVEIARRFAEAGFVALVLDYYAETGGAPVGSEEKIQKWEAWRETVRGAARYLQGLPGVAPEGIALVGFSRGAFLAVSVAASIPAVLGVVDFFGGGGGGTLPLEEEVRGLPPLLILHGERDRVVPVSFAHALQTAALGAGGEVEMHLFPNEGHAFNLPWAATYSPEAEKKAWLLTLAFLRIHLGG